MRLGHISTVCKSKGNSDVFYADILGLQEIKSMNIDSELTEKIFGNSVNCQLVLYGNDNFQVEVFIPEKFSGANFPYIHHCLEVDNKDEFLNKCDSAGLQINLVQKGDKTLSFVKDFDGNYFEIK